VVSLIFFNLLMTVEVGRTGPAERRAPPGVL